jgi:NAD(P)-dependent dehydrogenase (short-subunit alcohol dehydrogenase family)
VNVVGVLATCQAFLPLLRAGKFKGRIVNLGSVVCLPAMIAHGHMWGFLHSVDSDLATLTARHH